MCKDTVASISEPVQQNTYGVSDGAWMRDARGHGSVIYLTDGHYGNNLLEFRDMDAFKSGRQERINENSVFKRAKVLLVNSESMYFESTIGN